MKHHHHRIALLGAAAAAIAAPATYAQQTPAPAPAPTPTIITPGIGNFNLRPSGAQSQPTQPVRVPAATPTPAPTPAPTPRATPVAVRPTPQPTSRPAGTPTARVTPTPVPQASSTPAPVVTPTPVATAPVIASTPAPVVAQPAVPADEGGLPWLWMLAGAVLAGGIGVGGWLLGRRGRPVRRVESPPVQRAAPPPAPVAPPPAPRPVVPPPPPVNAPPPPLAEPIAIEFRPISFDLSEKGGVLDFELGLHNLSGAQADGLRISLLLVSANPDQDTMIAGFQASSPPPAGAPVDLPAGEGGRIPGKLAIEADRINVVQVGGRPIFVPMLLVELRWRGGLSLRRHGAAFMIGTSGQGQGGKLGPIWLDRGAQRFASLSATRYQPQARPAAA